VPTKPNGDLIDRLHRPLRDLRVSVTDRCNFRCRYCMPREVFGADFQFHSRAELLSFEEITRVVRLLVPHGVHKVRLTGGEPLLRRDIEELVAMVAAIEGVDDLAMTTNGALLANKADALRKAGLHRLTVSLDSIDPETFAATTDAPVPLATVLSGIEAAAAAGFAPIKLNAVVTRGVNDDRILDLVDYSRAGGHHLRLIEYMDVGSANEWQLDQVVPAEEIIGRISAAHELVPIAPATFGEVARRYRFADGRGEVGVITSVTQPFCTSCTRLRLTAIGELYTCLFGTAGLDIRAPLRAGQSDSELAGTVADLWRHRTDRYSELRSQLTSRLHKVEMFEVGG